MQLRIGLVIGLSLLLVACGTSEPTAGPEEPTTIAELDAQVRLSAQALLDKNSIPIAVIYFGFEDREEVVRYEWIDYRPAGDILAVTQSLSQEGTMALARSGGVWRSAMDTPQGVAPWDEDQTLGDSPVAVITQLEAMTTQTTPDSPPGEPGLTHEATRQLASDGSELWTLLVPHTDGPVETQQWIINPDGVLQFYRLYMDTPFLGADIGTMVVEYGVEDEDPDPVVIPDLGTRLRIDELGIPEPLRDLEE